jgi:5-methylcytosine-specific restriction endonuclease McrA
MAGQANIERNARIFARDGFRCVYCGYLGNTYETWRYLVVDHFHPRASGGGWAEENLVTACMDCNCIKTNEEFATVSEAKVKFDTLYLPIERCNFEKYFAPLIQPVESFTSPAIETF